MKRTVAGKIANLLVAIENCVVDKNGEWEERHRCVLKGVMKTHLPHGSGIDGEVDGWTEHEVQVFPDWDGVRLNITGKDRNEIKDYLYEVWHSALMKEVDYGVQS